MKKYLRMALLSEGTDEASIIQTARKMAKAFPSLSRAMERLINASKINQVTVKQQADKWLSHPADNYRKTAAILVDVIQVDEKNGWTFGPMEIIPITDWLSYDLERYMREVLSNDELQALYELPLRAGEQGISWADMARIWVENPPSMAHKIIAMSYWSWTNTFLFRDTVSAIINAED